MLLDGLLILMMPGGGAKTGFSMNKTRKVEPLSTIQEVVQLK